jgi:hypothetical protein
MRLPLRTLLLAMPLCVSHGLILYLAVAATLQFLVFRPRYLEGPLV